jgi:hypothetical protein
VGFFFLRERSFDMANEVDVKLAVRHGLRLSMDAWSVWVAVLLALLVRFGVLQHVSW